ncbi:hypothetical protein ZOD2009_01240 [Haladaptatus paucihalophilus DX253]|uniref:Glutathione synthetase, ATP-grasp domain n=1 Tax=Haladaptatus paucihalophilus DX253 TaxID=797209 RepID=E7QMT0_HALPU|nr:hypothetical protein [Haladaptatus paucihalophilus]EFW93725.1 hypothetical protein ZOD2009_01240 [Haladaptatus paucihalophilus DX253]SHL49097.1 glutathione synthetase, ATP-grasp domain [Haladaptatus paucihalophilus DX253]
MVRQESRSLGIVTGERAPELSENGRSVQAELRDRGWAAEPVIWMDEDIDWSRFDVALVRSCWNYHIRPDAFREWTEIVEEAGVTLLNPGEVVRWNMHKFYLRELAAEGVDILPTAWVERGSDGNLRTVLRENGWQEAVVKPAIGTSSANAWRTSVDEAADRQEEFETLVADRGVLVQQFAPEIADGERSLVFFGGEFSHARRRYPADGDFRAHNRYGGTGEAYDPPRKPVEQARDVLETACEILDIDPVSLPYARVDGLERGGDDGEGGDNRVGGDNRDGGDDEQTGEFHLMELELIEPYLSLDTREGAVTTFADAIESALRVVRK